MALMSAAWRCQRSESGARLEQQRLEQQRLEQQLDG
jgi:hypothetical protein